MYFLKVYQGCVFQVAKLRTWVDATIAANGGFGSTCDAQTDQPTGTHNIDCDFNIALNTLSTDVINSCYVRCEKR